MSLHLWGFQIHPPGYVSSDTRESNGSSSSETASFSAAVALDVDLPSEEEHFFLEEIKDTSPIRKVTPAAKVEISKSPVESIEQSAVPILEETVQNGAIAAPVEPSQEELESSAPRRRRRRSSAEVEKAKQLSLETDS
jgi:hypothetical protein